MIKKTALIIYCGILLLSCQPELPTTSSAPKIQSKVETSKALPTDDLPPKLELGNGIFLKDVLTSQQLNMRVGEELMLLGEVTFSDGQTLSFDQMKSLLNIKNASPDLLQIDLEKRIVRALKPGVATVNINIKNAPQIQKEIMLIIQGSSIDPTQAILNLEIG